MKLTFLFGCTYNFSVWRMISDVGNYPQAWYPYGGIFNTMTDHQSLFNIHKYRTYNKNYKTDRNKSLEEMSGWYDGWGVADRFKKQIIKTQKHL